MASRPKLFGLGLGLVAPGLVLVLTQCWPRSHKACSRGLIVSHRNDIIYVTFFSDRKLLLALLADRTNGRAIATLFRLSVRLSVCRL